MRNIVVLLIIAGSVLLATCGAPSTSTPVLVPSASSVATATAMSSAMPAQAAAGGSPLDVNRNCMVCHDLHEAAVVLMPHDPNPACNACHSGSPARIGCPSCHSMHQVEMEHPSDANLACVSCHAPGTVLPE